MKPQTNAKGNFQKLSNSLQQEQTTTDIESGTNARKASTMANKVFSDIFENIQEKRYHIDFKKRSVYKRLMNQLDNVEERNPKFTYSLIAVELTVLLVLTAALVCTLTLEKMKHGRFLRLRMWQWVTMVLMIASGLSVVRFITFLIFWPVKWWWRIHKYVVYFTRQLKRCVDVTLWFCIVLAGWYVWFRPRLKHVHGDLSVVVAHQVTRFLIALCLGSFLWLLKNCLYLKLEADLHYDQLFQRLQHSVVYMHGIQILHHRGMWKFLTDNKIKKRLRRMRCVYNKQNSNNDPKKEKEMMKGENIWMDVFNMEKESVPIWILRRLEEEYLDQVKLRPLPGNTHLTREDKKILREAKKLFRQLIIKRIRATDPAVPFKGIGTKDPFPFSEHEVKREDLVMYGLREEELDFIFKSRNKEEEEEQEDDEEEDAENDDHESTTQPSITASPSERAIGHDEFLNWAVRAFKNCWGLERTLCSSKRVFIKLNRLLSVFLLTVVLIIWLLLSEIVNTGQLALLFTPFVAASFIFGDSCKNMFSGLIFAFAMHPFDVGDRVIINNTQMRVTELNILTSVFYKYDTGEEVITPNSTLTTTSIINLDITPDQSDKLEFVVNPQTPLEDIKDLEIKIKKLLDDDIEYSSNSKVVKSEIGKDEMKMTVYFKYLVSYLTAETKAVHKSKILSMIMKFRKEMEMNNKEYHQSYKPYAVEINLEDCKLMLGDIEDLQAEILRGLESGSKVVMVELTKSRIKMGLYVGRLDHAKQEDKEKIDEGTSETRPKITITKIEVLEDILKRLKGKRVVKEVIIHQPNNNGDDEVVAQGSKKWGSFKANDVIQNQDPPSSSLETIHSGGAEEIRGDHGSLLLVGQMIAEGTTTEGN